MKRSQQPTAAAALPPDLEAVYGAAEKGDVQTLLAYLRSGATINFIHPASTDSPLMIACRRGHQNVVKVCLDYGGKNDPHPDFGQTALHAAVASGRLSCSAVILQVAQASEADTIISNLADQFGQTSLHTACIIGSLPVTELLLSHGARISSIDNFGQTPLHLCAGSGHKSVLAVLLDHGGDAFIDLPDVYGNSPLHHAAYHGKLDCAKLLLETAASVTARNTEGLTAFNLASIHGHQPISALINEYRSHYFGGADNALFDQRPSSAGFSRESSPYATPLGKDPLSIRKPDLRRAATDPYDPLPRPHTVSSASSPALSKPNQANRARTASSPRAASSPYVEDDYEDTMESGGVYGGYRVVSQLSTPLIIREKRSARVSSTGDDRFESPVKAFNEPRVVPRQPLLQTTYCGDISSDSSDGSPATPEHKSGRSPVRSAYSPVEQQQAEAEGSFADPLEVFNCCDLVWHAYETEQGDVYYLSMASSHSQWEDPRLHGVVTAANWEDLPANSPSKMSDTAPPLSPMRAGESTARSLLPAFGWEAEEVEQEVEEEEAVAEDDIEDRAPRITVTASTSNSLLSKSPERKQRVAAVGSIGARREGWEAATNRSVAPVAKAFSTHSAAQEERVVETQKEVELPTDECGRYISMLRAGKSLQEVRALLEDDQRSVAYITRIMAALDDCIVLDIDEDNDDNNGKAEALQTPVKAMASDPAAEQKQRLQLLLEQKPALSKYIKMINMGVLPMSVISKMKMDGVGADLLEEMQVALGLVNKEKDNKAWRPVPEERMKNSIWAFAQEEDNEGLLAEQELSDLENMFRTARESRSKHVAPAPAKQAMPLKILEGKRAQNIAIGLVPFRSCGSHADLMKAICGLNTLDGRLLVDNLENLRNMLPTEAELKISFRLQSPCHPSEIFFQIALLFYPELPVRLNTFILCLSFGDHANMIDKKFRMIMDAINQILSSSKLAKILKKLQAVGQALMQPGAAAGVRPVAGDGKASMLEQLLQISNTKGAAAHPLTLIDGFIFACRCGQEDQHHGLRGEEPVRQVRRESAGRDPRLGHRSG